MSKQVRQIARLIAPIVRTASHDRRTRQTVYEAASTLSGQSGENVLRRLGVFSQPMSEWFDTVRRGERRRRIRTLAGRIGILALAGGVIASRLMRRPHDPHGHANPVGTPDTAAAEVPTPLP